MGLTSTTGRDNVVHQGSVLGRRLGVAPLLLATFFGLWSLRGVNGSSIADYDAPRHAMNGAFVLDMFRRWQLAHPVKFGYWYYSRLPALSLPYHPPVFPTFEALFFWILGVNQLSSRLTIAFATAVAVLLMNRLVCRSHSSPSLALLVSACFFGLPTVQGLSNVIMLELPALVLVLAAMLHLVPHENIFQTSRSLWFAVFAATAIWTKQTAVFLFLLPFVYVLVSGRWSLLRRAYLWIEVGLIGISGLGLALLARQLQWNGINQSWPKRSVFQQVAHNWEFCLHYGVAWIAVAGLCVLTYGLPGGRDDLRRDRIYIAWLFAVMAVLLASPAYSARYAFFAIPPFVVLLCNGLWRAGRRISRRHEWTLATTVTVLYVACALANAPLSCLRGPTEAANFLHEGGYRRILYCGASNGAFTFAIRSKDPSLSTIIIRGDKLPDATFAPEQLSAFVWRYGIDAVVLESVPEPQAWNTLSPEALSFLSLERVVPVADSVRQTNGSLSIYRVSRPSKVSEDSLQVPISVLGREVELRF